VTTEQTRHSGVSGSPESGNVEKGPAAAAGAWVMSEETAWPQRYARRLVITDVLVVGWALAGTQLAWFGTEAARLSGAELLPFGLPLTYTVVTLAFFVSWLVILAVFASRDARIVGEGTTEYKLVVDSTVRLFGLIAIAAVLFQVDISRGYFLTALPVGLLGLLASRWIWRQWLVEQRRRGQFLSGAVIVGTTAGVNSLAAELASKPEAGYRVAGALIVGAPDASAWHGSGPATSNLDAVVALLTEAHANTVIVTSADQLTPERVRSLSWQLEPGRHHLVVAPSLTDIGGPRIHTRPVAGLSLLQIETPRHDGPQRFTKRAIDIAGSLVLLVLLAPGLIALAISVAIDSRGPVFFTQRRVGLNGQVFSMLKFRSMVADAEHQLAQLLPLQRDAGNAVLFKLAEDPRVTRVGRVLRRYSLDELPQLLNVLLGQMSLVGPRPPLESEVSNYEIHMHRRFLVKPGITGLWQVSGRSTLSWEESVRLDLYYVENWTMMTDVVILWRTVREVVRPRGAY
jgi:exopolysaccharide biosynthesis polyprenyl glycosylphosphotransferase